MLMIWYEVMGDDLVYTYSNAQFQKQAQWSSHRNATIGSATHFYRLLQYFISNSSMIIDNIDAAEGLESERNYIKGQAHFYRAFAYFTMVQMYGGRYKAEGDNTQLGVVIRNDNSTEPRARASVEEVYTQINEDIDLAIQLLGATEEKRTNKSHIDLHVARGLKARILLTQGKWLEAAEMAKLVVDLSGAKLQDDTYTTLNDRFSDQSNTEWLWGSNPLLQQAPNLTHFHGYMSNEIISYNGNTPRAIYNKLYDKISDTDVRKGIWFPRATDPNTLPRPIRAECNSKAYANYMANKFIVSDPTTKGGRDVPFMRLPGDDVDHGGGICTCWGARQSGSGSLSAGKSSGSGVYIVYENGRKLDRRGDDSTSHRALGGRFPLVRLETFEYGFGPWTGSSS